MLEQYTTLRERVRQVLQAFYEDELAKRDYTSSFYRKVHEQLAGFTLEGGKKFRPVLFLLSVDAYGGNPDALLPIAGAIELAHTFRIIHDDIIDHDTRRRGRPALHVSLNKLLPGKGEADAELGILAGDLVFVHAWRLALQANLPEGVLRRVLERFGEDVTHTLIGQMYDVHDTFKPLGKVKHEHILFTHTYKTAKYTFDLPLTLAAIVTQHDEDLDLLKEAATLIGIAYQLQDDYLSLYGEAAKLGKPLESDIQHGKKTLILKWTYDEASPADRKKLSHLLGRTPSEEEFAWLKQLVEATGVKQRIEAYIHDLYEEGIGMLREAHFQPDKRKSIEGFLRLIAERTY